MNELVRTQETRLVTLDGAPTLVRVTERGAIRAVRVEVTLDTQHGHLYVINGWEGGQKTARFRITADGYYKLNQVAQIHLHTPPTVGAWDGAEHPNPYVATDPEGRVTRVVVRKIGLGRGPLGNLVAVDQVVYFSPQQLLAQAAFRKWKGWKKKDGGYEAPKPWGRLVATAALGEEDRRQPGTLVLPYLEGSALLLDLSHPEVADLLAAHADVVHFADRRAATIAERNCLRKHPALATTTVVPDGGVFRVPVLGWVDEDRNLEEVSRLAVAVSEGRLDRAAAVAREEVAVAGRDAEEAGEEDVVETGGDLEAGEAPTEPTEAPEPTAEEPGTEDAAELRAAIRARGSGLSPAAKGRIQAALFPGRTLGDLDVPGLRKVLDTVAAEAAKELGI